jgi:hypothetical protein
MVVMAPVVTMAAAASAVTGAGVCHHGAENHQREGDLCEELHNLLLVIKSHGRRLLFYKCLLEREDGEDA